VLNSIFDEAESGIDDAANRVMPHCGSEVELPVAVVTVEPVPVVVVGVRARRDRDRVSRGVDGEIVEWGKHRCSGVQSLAVTAFASDLWCLARSPPHRPHRRATVGQHDLAGDAEAEALVIRHIFGFGGLEVGRRMFGVDTLQP
jgi:hypothetical protein